MRLCKILVADKYINLSSQHVLFQQCTDRTVKKAELFRHLDIKVQIPMIYGFDLNRKFVLLVLCLGSSKSCHAFNHNSSLTLNNS